MARTHAAKPVVSRSVAFGVVALAVLLSGVGLVLAVRQSRAVVLGRIADLRPEARDRIATVQQTVTAKLNEALRTIAQRCVPAGDGGAQRAPRRPRWLGTVFVWDGPLALTGAALNPPRALSETAGADHGLIDVEQLRLLVSGRLHPRLLATGGASAAETTGSLFDTLAGRPVVIAYRVNVAAKNAAPAVAAVLDLARVRDELLAPQITRGDDLALVDLPVGSDTAASAGIGWSETLGPTFPFWAVQPSATFVARQQAAGTRQTLACAAITVLALLALLVAFRALSRVVEHEVTLSRMKSSFVADVSHELKTPLALIRMFGETLLEGRVKSPEKAKEYHTIITRESTRLTHLIDNILDFARIDAGRKQYRMEPVDVGRVVRETYESYRHELDHHGFEHECTIAENIPETSGDADAIGQVLLNLINNAVKYAGDEKHLGVEVAPETRRGKHGVLISVRDRGIGIRPEDRARLFDGFFRASDERVRDRRGAGLGLALCKHIVDAHGGFIDVESRLVKGSTFRIFLPEKTTMAPDEEAH